MEEVGMEGCPHCFRCGARMGFTWFEGIGDDVYYCVGTIFEDRIHERVNIHVLGGVKQ